jgi:hypothetical protein
VLVFSHVATAAEFHSPSIFHLSGALRVYVPKAVTFFPFLMSWTRTHFRIAELGCLASTPTFSRTMPLAWEEPPNGEDLKAVPKRRFLKDRSAQRCSRRWLRSLRAALRPLGFPAIHCERTSSIWVAVRGRASRRLLSSSVLRGIREGELRTFTHVCGVAGDVSDGESAGEVRSSSVGVASQIRVCACQVLTSKGEGAARA